MSSALDDDIWDDAFHGAAWAAYIELAAQHQTLPDSETTRRYAFRLYEEWLAARSLDRSR